MTNTGVLNPDANVTQLNSSCKVNKETRPSTLKITHTAQFTQFGVETPRVVKKVPHRCIGKTKISIVHPR